MVRVGIAGTVGLLSLSASFYIRMSSVATALYIAKMGRDE